MSRPAGSKNKLKSFGQQAEERDRTIYPSVLSPVVIENSNLKPPIRYDAIFGVRSLRSGNFKGLWELVQLDEAGNRKVLTDANSRGMIITMINRQIMKIVVMQ